MKAPPAFQFYPADYLSSAHVQMMSLAAQGAYIRLLCYQWQDGFIPDDIQKLAPLCGSRVPQMKTLWPQLSECFDLVVGPGKIANKRLELVRKEQLEYRIRQSEFGKKGASIKKGTLMGTNKGNGKGKASSSSSSSSSSLNTNTEEENKPPIVPLEILRLGEFGWVRITMEQKTKLEVLTGERFHEFVGRFDRWVNEAPDAKDKNKVKRRDRHAYESIQNWYVMELKQSKNGSNGNGQYRFETRAEAIIRKQKESGERVRELLRGSTCNGSGPGDPSGEKPALCSGIKRPD